MKRKRLVILSVMIFAIALCGGTLKAFIKSASAQWSCSSPSCCSNGEWIGDPPIYGCYDPQPPSCTDPTICPTYTGGGGATVVPSQTCVYYDAYTLYCNIYTAGNANTTWTDCVPGATPVTWSPFSCAPTTSTGGGGGVVVIVTPAPSVDLKVNGSDGPINVNAGSPINITWSTANASNCDASNSGASTWTGGRALSNSTGEDHSSDSNVIGTITYSLTCGGAGGSGIDSVTVNIVRVFSITCTMVGGFTIPVEAGQDTTLTFGFTNGINSVNIVDGVDNMTFSGPGVQPTRVWYTPNGNGTVAPGGTGSVSYVIKIPANSITPSYTVSWTIRSTMCSGTLTTNKKPYMRVYGSEVITGSGFQDASGNCNMSSLSRAIGFASSPKGSGSQYGVVSRGQVLEFLSASNNSGLNRPLPPKGLTFSNINVGPIPDTYGGNFGTVGSAGIPCITDYYGTTKDTSLSEKSIPQNTPISIAANSARVRYQLNGNFSLGRLSVPNGTQAAIYVDGNLTITNNIYLNEGAALPNGENNLSNLAVIVKGNIYITNNVTRIDGLFVAQPRTSPQNEGRIYTCAKINNILYTAGELKNNCNQPLAVNGALVAQRIKFLRTLNTAFDSTGAVEVPNFKDGSPSGQGANTKAAEVINYIPQLYIAPSALKDPSSSCSATTCKYDAIYSLPPVY